MKDFMTLLKKELTRVFSDKKLVFSAFLLPGIMIFIIYSAMGILFDSNINKLQTTESTIYVNYLPDSVEDYFDSVFASEDGYLIGEKYIEFITTDDPDATKLAVESGTVDLYVVFDVDFDVKIAAVQATSIETYYNSVKNNSTTTQSVFISMMTLYEDHVIEDRVGSSNLITFGYTSSDISPVADSNPMVISMLPFMIVILMISGSMGLGIDMVAGEKEKGTLTVYLLAPVSRFVIALSKVVSLAIMTIISAISSLIGIYLSMDSFSSMYGVDEGTGLGLSLSVGEFAGLALVVLSLAILVTCVIVLLSLMSKDVKQANTVIAPFLIVASMASMLLLFVDSIPTSIFPYLIPFYNSALMVKAILLMESTMATVLIVTLVSLVYSAIIIFFMKIMMSKEKVIFGD